MMLDDSMAVLQDAREGLMARLPVLLLALALMANGLFASLMLVPAWMDFQVASSQRTVQQATLAALENEAEADIVVLQAQVDDLNSDLERIANQFLNPVQVDMIVSEVYGAAAATGVAIERVELLRAVEGTEADAPYRDQAFHVEVSGADMATVMNFSIHLRSVALLPVDVQGLHLWTSEDGAHLSLQLHLYLSESSTGIDLKNLSSYPPVAHGAVPTLLPTVQPTPMQTPTVAANASAPLPLKDTPPTEPPDATALPPTPPADTTCNGAPITPFAVGDTLVVNFDEAGALRVMQDYRTGPISTIIQLYDGDQVTILSGPLCGDWQGTPIWYWYIEIGGVRGWIGEGTADKRWLCRPDDRDCS